MLLLTMLVSEMRTILLSMLLVCAMGTKVQAQVKHLRPSRITEMPKISAEAYLKGFEVLEDENLSEAERKRVGDLTVYTDLYAGFCSWYCGGEVLSVKASSCLKPQGRVTYEASHAHDFNHQSVWAEGVAGQGIGEWLEYEFAGRCPRITTVKILGGHVKSDKAWRANSRPKTIRMYYMGKPYAILELEDSRTLQCFDVGTLGPHDAAAPHWTLRFEILDVYPGAQFADTVISEIYFDGIDVH